MGIHQDRIGAAGSLGDPTVFIRCIRGKHVVTLIVNTILLLEPAIEIEGT
jgi:hypothetical protein